MRDDAGGKLKEQVDFALLIEAAHRAADGRIAPERHDTLDPADPASPDPERADE